MRCYLDPPMAEIRTATTLRTKEAEIERAIAGYERALEQARADLAHIRAVIAMFDRAGVADAVTPYTSLRFIFSRSELAGVCLAALNQRSPQNTRELTEAVLKAKGLDAGDKVLSRTTMLKVVQVMRRLEQSKKAVAVGRENKPRVIIWALPARTPR